MIDLEKKPSISQISNSTLFNAKEQAYEAANDHRYLQHQMFMFCVHFIDLMAKNYNKNRYDARNEFACKTASDMVNAYQESIKDSQDFSFEFTEYKVK